mgnify:CR=1 FL=1
MCIRDRTIPLNLVEASLVPGAKQIARDKIARNPVTFDAERPMLRKPDWIRVRLPSTNAVQQLKNKLRESALVTVCEEASCPNIHECFAKGTATFMVLGEVCTRRCSFCHVAHGRPTPADVNEPTPSAQTIPALPKTMASVICHAPEDYRLEEIPVPEVGPGEVLVKVASAGICASDLKCYLGAPLFWGDASRAGYCQPPITPGHEFVGQVVALGEGAGQKYGLQLGDIAISEQIVPCWECRFCRRGQYWMCPNGSVYGFRQNAFGALAEYMRFPANAPNYRVPDAVPLAHAAYIEPLACAIHAVERADIHFGDVVVVAGAGPLGLGMVAAAQQYPAQAGQAKSSQGNPFLFHAPVMP